MLAGMSRSNAPLSQARGGREPGVTGTSPGTGDTPESILSAGRVARGGGLDRLLATAQEHPDRPEQNRADRERHGHDHAPERTEHGDAGARTDVGEGRGRDDDQ